MPMWCPPTPPSGDGDVYCESWARALYRAGAAPDALLPPVHRREARGAREPRRARALALARPAHAPLSLFERAGAKPRPRARPPPAAHAHAHAHQPHAHPTHAHASPATAAPPQPEWAGGEDAALRRALRLQRLPAEPPAALAPNWDWVAELVNEAARAYRSARACRDRHDALADPERVRRRHRRPPAARRRLDDDRPRPPLHRLDAMRDAAERRRAAPKRRLDDPQHRNPKHAQLLAEHSVEYDAPPTPMEVAARRADRIAREKLKASGAAATPPPATAPAPAASVAASSAPAAATPPAPVTVASRVVVATPAARADAPRRARPQPPPQQPQAHLLYRQQAFPARHLKILHQGAAAPAHLHVQGATTSAGASAGVGAGEGGAALRKLQLQQLALRRAGVAGGASGAAPPAAPPAGAPRLVAAARHPHHSHVVVAHLAAPPASPHQPQPQPQQDRPGRQ